GREPFPWPVSCGSDFLCCRPAGAWPPCSPPGWSSSWFSRTPSFPRETSIASPGQRARCSPTPSRPERSEEHTSELQSRGHLVCRSLRPFPTRRSSDLWPRTIPLARFLRFRLPLLSPGRSLAAMLASWLVVKLVFTHAVIPARNVNREPRAKGAVLAHAVPAGKIGRAHV